MASSQPKPIIKSPRADAKVPNNIMGFLLSNNSIDKATYEKSRADRMIEANKKRKLILEEQKVIRKFTEKRRYVQESWEKCLRNEVSGFYDKKKLYDQAAVKIQKIVKGFLVRIRVDPMLLQLREENCHVFVKELRKQTDFCMLTLGSNTVPAVKCIQGAYRRYRFKKKLEVLKACYMSYLIEREEVVCDYLRKIMCNFYCKMQKAQLEFFKYRIGRLEQIKRTLAILTVKKIWRAKKFTVKIIREKFLRIKRRKAAMQNKEAYQKYLATLGGAGGKKEMSKKQAENASKDSKEFTEDKKEEEPQGERKENNPEEDEDYKEAQRIKEIIESKIKEKVSMSKLAYALTTEDKPKVIYPMMQEKAINESLDVEALQSKLLCMTASVFAKGRCLTRSKGETTRNYMITSPRPVSQRKYVDKAILPPLTILQPAEVTLSATAPILYLPAINENFLEPTISSQNKAEPLILPDWKRRELDRLNRKKQARKFEKMHLDFIKSQEVNEGSKRVTREIKPRERTNHWIPVARRFSSYISGLDNSAYIPIKWNPLPLNKRILNTAITTVYTNRQDSPVGSSEIKQIDVARMTFSDTAKQRKFFRERNVSSGSPSTQEHSGDLF